MVNSKVRKSQLTGFTFGLLFQQRRNMSKSFFALTTCNAFVIFYPCIILMG